MILYFKLWLMILIAIIVALVIMLLAVQTAHAAGPAVCGPGGYALLDNFSLYPADCGASAAEVGFEMSPTGNPPGIRATRFG
jgi:hypothetical protein